MNECWKFFRYAEINDTNKIINIFNVKEKYQFIKLN